MEIKLKFEKSNVINESKSVQKEQIVVPMKKNIGIQDTLSSNVRKIQYTNLVTSHQEFLIDFLKKDQERQEIMQSYIKAILELNEKNALLEYENMQLREALQKK